MKPRSAVRSIKTIADLKEGCVHLSQACPVMARLVGETELPPLRRRKGGFESLVNIVISQQLSVAAADTIEGRLRGRLRKITPDKISRAREPMLRSCGLSGAKIRTLKALAKAVKTGKLDFKFIDTAPVEDARAVLTSITGIGPWTADIYIMFSLGHADGFAPGDLALQEAARLAYGWKARPDALKLEKHAALWSPWRGVAARLLWSYYSKARAESKGQAKTRQCD